jgi:hypothetical protein
MLLSIDQSTPMRAAHVRIASAGYWLLCMHGGLQRTDRAPITRQTQSQSPPPPPKKKKNQLGVNISDAAGIVGLDADSGPYKLGYDIKRKVGGWVGGGGGASVAAHWAAHHFPHHSNSLSLSLPLSPLLPTHNQQRTQQDLAFQYTHKGQGSTLKVRQVVPGLKWEVVPTPVVELSTKLLDGARWRDSLRLTYDFMNRNGARARVDGGFCVTAVFLLRLQSVCV